MTSLFSNKGGTVLFIVLSLFSLSACGAGPVAPTSKPAATTAATEAPAAQKYPDELTVQGTYGSGPFTYAYPITGLSELPAYKATLTMTFEGTQAGQAQEWSKVYTMLATREPQARELTIETTPASAQIQPVLLAEMDGLTYERRGQDPCTANVIQEGSTSLSDRLAPASLLSGVIGANEAGSETVNGVEAKHYTFDQAALGEQALTESTGEMWVASEGNYIVKYLLTQKGKADYFGEGTEGTLTLDYELSDPSQPVTIALPEDCPPGLIDVPLLQDASNVTNDPGLLSYDTATKLSDVVAFYQEQIHGLGWTADGEPIVEDTSAFLDYTKGTQSLSVVVSTADNVTTVTILLENSQQ